MNSTKIHSAFFAFFTLAVAPTLIGQILYNTPNSAILLNFDNLNTNYGGAYNSTGGSTAFPTSGTSTTIYSGETSPAFVTNFADFTPGGVYSNTGTYVNSNSMRALRDGTSSDYAIGLKNSSDQTLTLRIKNTTGSTLTNWLVDYDVEQYSKGASATLISFSYSLNGSSFITTGITGGTAVAANNTAPVDVNLSSVLSTSRSASISASVVNNSEIYFRWTYDHQGGTSAHIGLDNVSVSAIPEPSTFAALLGLTALAGAATRRRRVAV